jgi:hypothetical protein
VYNLGGGSTSTSTSSTSSDDSTDNNAPPSTLVQFHFDHNAGHRIYASSDTNDVGDTASLVISIGSANDHTPTREDDYTTDSSCNSNSSLLSLRHLTFSSTQLISFTLATATRTTILCTTPVVTPSSSTGASATRPTSPSTRYSTPIGTNSQKPRTPSPSPHRHLYLTCKTSTQHRYARSMRTPFRHLQPPTIHSFLILLSFSR